MSEDRADRVMIAVPRQYRDHLIRVQNRRYGTTLSLYVGTVMFFGLVTHWGWHVDLVQPVLVVIALITWSRQLKRPWQYVIDKEHMTVTWWQMGGRVWDWFEVRWRRDAVIGVEETEWRGLPAMRILRQTKRLQYRPDWLIVYAHEDREKVTTQVLPLIENCRRQYRQAQWADRLRS